MPAAAGAGVAALLTSAGATAATAAAAGALATAVVSGAIYGAVIGAVTSLVTGGDIVQGALKGAAIGGVTGGVIKGFSMAGEAASAATATETSAAAPSAAAESGTSGAVKAVESGKMLTDAGTKGIEAVQGVPAPTAPPQTGIISGAATPVAEQTTKDAILSGVGEGLASGVGIVGASMLEADKAKDLAEFEAQQQQNLINQNVPGKFEAKVGYMDIPNWWDEHINPNANANI